MQNNASQILILIKINNSFHLLNQFESIFHCNLFYVLKIFKDLTMFVNKVFRQHFQSTFQLALAPTKHKSLKISRHFNRSISTTVDYLRPFDYCVIGGGIVGLAVARELKRRQPVARIALLEKESQIGQHQSKWNSGVIHQGIYYK
jgi:hypothetical protein